MSVGYRIKKRREELGWTQRALARKAQLSPGFLSDVENNKRLPGSGSLRRIAGALGLSLDYIMFGDVYSERDASRITIPQSLADFAYTEGITFQQTMILLGIQRQLTQFTKSNDSENYDWRRLYEAIKDLLS